MILYHAWTNKASFPGERTARTRMMQGLLLDVMREGGLLEFPRNATENYDEDESCFVGASYEHVSTENTEVEILYTRSLARWCLRGHDPVTIGALRLAPFAASGLVVFRKAPRWTGLRLGYLLICIGILL